MGISEKQYSHFFVVTGTGSSNLLSLLICLTTKNNEKDMIKNSIIVFKNTP